MILVLGFSNWKVGVEVGVNITFYMKAYTIHNFTNMYYTIDFVPFYLILRFIFVFKI